MVKVVSSQHAHIGEPASVVAGLNSILCREVREQYVTAVYQCLDAVTGTARYSAAAHPPTLLWRRGKQPLETLEELGFSLECDYAESEFSFEIGNRLLLYTDGLLEAENSGGRSFGDALLPTVIQENQDLGT